MMLQNEILQLRALEPEDLQLLYNLENEETTWEVSGTVTPYSKYVLKQYLANAHKDIYEVKQLRLVIISKSENKAVGFIDLFDFEPKHKRVGVGIVIFSEANKQKGFASNALTLVKNYVFNQLLVHQLYANITKDNKASIALFEKVGFQQTGVKKEWLASKDGYKDVFLYQLIAKN